MRVRILECNICNYKQIVNEEHKFPDGWNDIDIDKWLSLQTSMSFDICPKCSKQYGKILEVAIPRKKSCYELERGL